MMVGMRVCCSVPLSLFISVVVVPLGWKTCLKSVGNRCVSIALPLLGSLFHFPCGLLNNTDMLKQLNI